MKSPIPLLLYLTSAGLFGLAGWTVYQMLPMWKDAARKAATAKGSEEGTGLISKGKGGGPPSTKWDYSPGEWWATFKQANLIGKLPPPPAEPDGPKEPEAPPPPPVTPLEDIFELVAIMHDPETGKGGNSQVILRYKAEANVQPPEWWVRENMAGAAAGGTAGAVPRDVTPSRAANGRPGVPPPTQPAARPNPAGRPTAPTTPMPVSSVGREMLQRAWVDDGGDPRRSAQLWAPYSHIRLVRVAPDAQSAFFVRTPPPPKPGETAEPPKEEEVLKTSLTISQSVLEEIRRVQGQSSATRATTSTVADSPGKWVDVEETTVVGKTVNIGRNDEKRFRENADQFLAQLKLDTYRSPNSQLKGLQVRNIDPKVAQRFGIQETDVLVEVNGRPVQTLAQARQMGKNDYDRGVRTFHTKWWSNGVLVERVYQIPDK